MHSWVRNSAVGWECCSWGPSHGQASPDPITVQHANVAATKIIIPHPIPAAPLSLRHLVLQDLMRHQLLQEVAMHGVARLRPAADGGPLE